MGMTDLDRRIETIADQLAERFNLAISKAVDEKNRFEDGEEIFRDTIAVLDYYNCNDIESDQLLNFSKVAFFRKKYDKALFYAAEAVAKSETDGRKKNAEENLHAMAFKIFEILLVTTEDFHDQIDFEGLQEYLMPEDYCAAIRNTYSARKNIKTQEDKTFLTGVLSKLSQELIRQGVRQEKCGNREGALLLFRTVFPFLNPKKAAAVSKEIEKMEAVGV
ncbi:MAG: hypothetical protein J6Z35_03715 [Lachnospiraceae bacterium]|nr:hypothetical protein [Lachnospiraceae bacterium]